MLVSQYKISYHMLDRAQHIDHDNDTTTYLWVIAMVVWLTSAAWHCHWYLMSLVDAQLHGEFPHGSY